MARLTQIVIDCDRPATLARFWAATLDGFEVRADDEAEGRRLADLGLTTDRLVAEVDRLVDLGATVQQTFATHTWMLDPEGNDFCVVEGPAAD
ncbi:MAG: hypothetical protein JJE52_14935 [Acidimicrobiia bacterium]|nr:hypothetical protein [Acidimicrobiia bacterium]